MSTTIETTPTTRLTLRVSDVPNLDPPAPYTPVYELSGGGLPQVLLPSGHRAVHLTAYADVLAVLSDSTYGRAGTNVETGPSFLPTVMPTELLLNLDVPDHARMRQFVNADYSAASVRSLEPVVDSVLNRRIELLRNESHPDLCSTVLERVPVEVNSAFLGFPLSDIEHFRPSSRVVQMAPFEDVPDLLEHFWLVYDYVTDLVAGRRDTVPGGLVHRFLSRRDTAEPPLADEELVALLLGSVLGADHNVLSVLSKAVYVLLHSPELWAQLASDPDCAPAVVEELLRILPLGTISTFPRLATVDMPTSTGTVRAGDVVYADAFAANRDPDTFPDPELIDPVRRGKRHLQFGYGMHHCMGASLARMQLTRTLSTLASEFPTLKLAAPAAALPWDTGVLLRRPVALPVRW